MNMKAPDKFDEILMVLKDIDTVPKGPFPWGFRMRPMGEKDIELWVDIWRGGRLQVRGGASTIAAHIRHGHWVVIRKVWQGRGLAKAMLSFTLRKLAQWHDWCYLVSHWYRLPAIRLYKKFGFEPVLDDPALARSWARVGEDQSL